MNDDRIDYLIGQRNKLTNRRDEWVDWKRVDAIDEKLKQVEPGERNDVDLLLGRPEARLAARVVTRLEEEERREGWITPPTVTAEEVGPIVDEMMKRYGATMKENPKDWRDLKGDCDL